MRLRSQFLFLVAVVPFVHSVHLLHQRDLSPTDAFLIHFDCASSDQAFCTRAKSAATRATNRIAQEFRFRMPVTVTLSMYLPCGSNNPSPSCGEITSIGQAIPALSFPIRHKDDGIIYNYPSALLKQLDLVPDGTTVAWPQYDIIAKFNALWQWWFEGDPLPMSSNARDLEYTITHELLHGLGFGTDSVMSWQPSSTVQALLPWYASTPPSVMPNPSEGSMPSGRSVTNDGQYFFAFSRPFIWDRFLAVGQSPSLVPMTSIWTNFTNIVQRLITEGTIPALTGTLQQDANTVLDPKSNMNVTAHDPVYSPNVVVQALSNDRVATRIMTSLYTLGTTPGNAVFDPKSWPAIMNQLTTIGGINTSVMVLETNLRPFAPGSSLWHVALPTTSPPSSDNSVSSSNSDVPPPGPDFLMTWMLRALSFKQISDASALINGPLARPSGIGPGIIASLVALGYTPTSLRDGFISRKDVAEVVTEAIGAPTKGKSKPTTSNAMGRGYATFGSVTLMIGMIVIGLSL